MIMKRVSGRGKSGWELGTEDRIFNSRKIPVPTYVRVSAGLWYGKVNGGILFKLPYSMREYLIA